MDADDPFFDLEPPDATGNTVSAADVDAILYGASDESS